MKNTTAEQTTFEAKVTVRLEVELTVPYLGVDSFDHVRELVPGLAKQLVKESIEAHVKDAKWRPGYLLNRDAEVEVLEVRGVWKPEQDAAE